MFPVNVNMIIKCIFAQQSLLNFWPMNQEDLKK